MDKSTKPTKGLYCPKVEDHTGSHLLLTLNDDSIFVRCKKHDWLRVDMYQNGQQISFKDIAVVVSDMPVPNGRRGHFFKLNPLPILAKGVFNLKNRMFREELRQEGKNK